jgi:long-chain acyl-CoA synthetase
MIVILEKIREGNCPRSDQALADFAARDSTESRSRGGIGNCFLSVARRRIEHPAFINRGEGVSYSCIAQAALSVAAFLRKQPGFASTSKVVLVMENCPEYLAGFYGILLAGGVVVPLPESIEPSRLSQVLEATKANIVLTSSKLATTRLDFVARASRKIELAGDVSDFTVRTRAADDLAAIFFTSGTTSHPKGVMLSHRNLLANAESICGFLPITQQDRALALLPFCHSYGNSVLQTHVLSGASLVVDGSTVFPNTIVDAIEQHQVTSLAGVPEMFYSLLSCSDLGKRQLPSLRYMTVAGGPMDSSEAAEVAELISPAEFFVMYGQTEATARLSYLAPSELSRRPDSIGKAIPEVEIEVHDEHDRAVRPGEIGELCARGANIMRGYWDNDTATSCVIRNGWLRTGDLATFDDEGYLYLKGRRNEQLKIRGLKVVPREIERILLGHFPAARLAVVPFVLLGTTRIALFLVRGSDLFQVQQVKRVCAEVLARHEQPSYFEVLDDLPRTASMKTDRQQLARRAVEQLSDHRTPSKPNLQIPRRSAAALTLANPE